jgi:hypothetical protein
MTLVDAAIICAEQAECTGGGHEDSFLRILVNPRYSTGV